MNEWLTLLPTGPRTAHLQQPAPAAPIQVSARSHSCSVWSRSLQGQKQCQRELHMTHIWSRSGEQKDLPCGASSPGASRWGKHLFLPHQPWGPCPPASPDTLPAFLIPLWDNPTRASPGQQSPAAGISGSGQLGIKQAAPYKL